VDGYGRRVYFLGGYWTARRPVSSFFFFVVFVMAGFWPNTRGSVIGFLLRVARLAPYHRGCGIGRMVGLPRDCNAVRWPYTWTGGFFVT